MLIKFKILTPERTVFEDTVDQATLPVIGGEVTILPNHRSYIASLSTGEIMVKKGKEEFLLFISGGFIEFHDNTLTILADTAERAEEIDLKLAEEAKARAEKLQGEATVAATIQRHAARVRVAQKHYTRRGRADESSQAALEVTERIRRTESGLEKSSLGRDEKKSSEEKTLSIRYTDSGKTNDKKKTETEK